MALLGRSRSAPAHRSPASSLALVALLLSAFSAGACGGSTFDTGDGDGGSGSDGSASGGSGAGGSDEVDTSCEAASDCNIVSATCCGSCGAPSPTDMVAVRVGQEARHQEEVCGAEPPMCPACAAQADPNLFATCERGTCVANDLRQHEASACVEDDQCIVRPVACCPCGASSEPWELVAMNSESSAFIDFVCKDAGAVCAECAWVPPEGVSAACVRGQCLVEDERVP